jgi:hypothetical protein
MQVSGANVTITIFGDFDQFRAKKMAIKKANFEVIFAIK